MAASSSSSSCYLGHGREAVDAFNAACTQLQVRGNITSEDIKGLEGLRDVLKTIFDKEISALRAPAAGVGTGSAGTEELIRKTAKDHDLAVARTDAAIQGLSAVVQITPRNMKKSPSELAQSATVDRTASTPEVHHEASRRQLRSLTTISWDQIFTYRNALGLLHGREPSSPLTPDDLHAVLQDCVNVTHLDYPSIGRASLQRLTAPLPDLLLPALRSINLEYCGLTDTDLTALVKRYPKFASLNLRGCSDLTDDGIAEIAAHCKDLTHLNLNRCEQISHFGIAEIAANCPELRSLSLRNNITLVTNAALVAALVAIGTGCPKLTSLDLTGIELMDAEIAAIIARCPNLTSLWLLSCHNLAAASFAAIARCRRLTSLDVSFNSDLKDVAFASALDIGFPELTSLDLIDCRELTAGGIAALVARCPKLASLNLAVNDLTNTDIDTIATGCPGLTFIDLGGNGTLSLRGIVALITRCPRLASIDIGACRRLPYTVAAALAADYPAITILH